MDKKTSNTGVNGVDVIFKCPRKSPKFQAHYKSLCKGCKGMDGVIKKVAMIYGSKVIQIFITYLLSYTITWVSEGWENNVNMKYKWHDSTSEWK